MMKQIPFQKLLPYVVGVLIFLLVTIIYFNPLLSGKRINQGDIVQYKGASKEIADYRNKTGDEALWTNSMFGGMPAYQISIQYPENLLNHIDKAIQFGLPRPAGLVLIYFLGFFLLLLVLRVNPWLSILGALAFGFSSYFFIILEAGHNTKAAAIAYMAPVFAGIILTYRGKYLWGLLLTALFLALEIKSNHPQITYYLLLIVLIYGIYELIHNSKFKLPLLIYVKREFLKKTGLLIIAVLFAVLPNLTSLWTTYEYSKYTIRGKSELTSNEGIRTSGLDKDYATQWSYGIGESFSLMVPNIKGGKSGYLGNNPKALENVETEYKQYVSQSSHYWGNQPFTSGPVYAGAVIIFFFVLGLFIVKGRLKWVLLTATIVSLMLSWGKNFMPLTDFFLEYFPLYNKFRAVSMILVIAEFCIPVLAILAINELIKKPEAVKENIKSILIALGATAGLSLLFYVAPSVFFNFFSEMELAQFEQFRSGPNSAGVLLILDAIESARVTIFRADVLRSIFFIVLAFAAIYLLYLKKIKTNVFLLILGVIVLLDLVPVCYRYLNNDNYVRKAKMERPFQATVADKEILKDKSLDYRVYNLATNTFNESATSYFHKTVGGYHGAKLRRYQELIDHHIMPEFEALVSTLTNSPTLQMLDSTMAELDVLNMLNTKYFIIDPSRHPLFNKSALGNAWFVNDVQYADNADEEIDVLKNISVTKTAVVDNRFSELVDESYAMDSTALIDMISYEPNYLVYQSISSVKQLAVFSEIYYPKGWNAYIDGQLVQYLRVNYVLRALEVPEGEHKIEFKFEPQSYASGRIVSLISSIFLLLVLAGVIGFEIKRYSKTT